MSLEPGPPVPAVIEDGDATSAGLTRRPPASEAVAVSRKVAAVGGVDGRDQRAGDGVESALVLVQRAAGLGDVQQRAEAAAGRPGVARGGAGPGRGRAVDHLVGGAGRRGVDEGHLHGAGLADRLDRDLAELGELVEQQVAAVEQVVRLVARRHLALDRVVEGRDLLGELGDLAARIAGARGPHEVGVLGHRLGADRGQLVVDRAEGVRQRARPARAAPGARPGRPGRWRGPTRSPRTRSAGR